MDISFSQFLNEASLSRVYEYTKTRAIGIISACRFDNKLSAQENQKNNDQRTAQLKSDLRSANYGYINVKGRFIENMGTPNEKKVDELSFLVIGDNKDDNGHLKGWLKSEGTKYNQDSILYKPWNSEVAVLIGLKSGTFPGLNAEHALGTFHPNKMSEFQTVLKRNATFTFSESFIFTSDYQRGFFSRGPNKETLF